MRLVAFLIIGLVAGWAAGYLMKGRGFGWAGNLFVGVLGSLFGGFVFSLLGIYASGFVGSLVLATMGAVLFLFLMMFMKKQL